MHARERSRSTKVPVQRTRRGCLTCRKRKVKCDEKPGRCGNCDRLGLECLWESREGERLQRSRQSRACTRCRDKKLKCLGVEAIQGCRRCIEVGAQCVPPNNDGSTQAHRPIHRAVATAAEPGDGQLPNNHTLTSLLDSFFEGPHRFCFYTFLRRKATSPMLDGLIPRPLLLIISATALRVRDATSPLPDKWADEARELAVRDVFRGMSTTNLQTLLLLQRYEWHRGSHVSAWFVAGLAIRLATALQLTQDPSEARGSAGVELPVSVMETRRRLVWSCFAMDSVPDAGDRPGNPSIEADTIKARLPCDEESYEQGAESVQPHLHDPISSLDGAPSISALLIRVVLLRLRMLQYSYPFYPQCSAEQHSQAPWSPQSAFHNWKAKMDEFGRCLATAFPLESISPSSAQPFLISLFTVHTMYHAAYTDLLRSGTHKKPRGHFDASDPASHPFFEVCKRGRVEHALRMAEVVSRCVRSRCWQHDPFMAICSCLALRILVVERWHDGRELVDISSPKVRETLGDCRSCAIRTAHWSRPIRRLLFAVGDLVLRHGYDLRLSDSSLPTTPKEPTRAGTPGLQIYGTAGTINQARKAYDLESAASQADDQSPEMPSVGVAAITAADTPQDGMRGAGGASYNLLQAQAEPSLDNLGLANSGSDGVYEWELGQMAMGWADFDMRWIYGLDQAGWGAESGWGMEGMG